MNATARKPPRRKPPSRKPQPKPATSGRWKVWLIALGIGAVLVVGAIAGRGPADTAGESQASAAVVSEGEQLFLASCSACHGSDLRGTSVGPPFLDVIYAPNHHGDESFQLAAANGVVSHHWGFGPMPPIPALTRDDVGKIVAYVRVQQQAEGIFRDPTHP